MVNTTPEEQEALVSVIDLCGSVAPLGSCAQMKLCGRHLCDAAALEGRKYSDAAAAGVADRRDVVFDWDASLALALFA
jgi:hypothetical protein